MILVPKFSEKHVVLNQIYTFKFTRVFGVQKEPKTSNFGSKLMQPLVKKQTNVRHHFDVSLYPIFKILVSKSL